MKNTADTMPAVFSDNGVVICLCVLLNNMPNVSKSDTWLNDVNGFVHTFLSNAYQALGVAWGLAHAKHFASVAMKAIFDDGDVDIDDIARL